MITTFNLTPIDCDRVGYWSYCDRINIQALLLNFKLPHLFDVTFVFPMPNSWDKEKKSIMDGQIHEVGPNINRLYKGFLDAFFDKDNCIYYASPRKIWGFSGKIIVKSA